MTARLRIDIRDLTKERLPPICIVCGKPSDTVVQQIFASWANSRLIVSTKDPASVPVCNRHRHHWRNMRLLFSAAMMTGILVLVGVPMIGIQFLPLVDKGWRIVVGMGSLFLGLVAFVLWIGISASELRKRKVSAAGFGENSVYLDNVSTEFAKACVEQFGNSAQQR